VRISAKVDYALRALTVLADAGSARTKGDVIAAQQGIPLHFLENILRDLKRSGIVNARRGSTGGYYLAVAADSLTVADVIRIVEGPLADVHGKAPEDVAYPGPAAALRDLWVAVRANLRAVLETVTLADVATGRLPDTVADLVNPPDAWVRR
jgi:Rrf2 family protein